MICFGCVLGPQADVLPVTDGRFTATQALFNLVNGVLGVGVLGYPYSFKECGVLLGTVIVLSCLAVCLFSVRLLLISSHLSGQKSFEDIAAAALGSPGRLLVKVCIVAVNLGALVAYLNIIADVLSSVAGTIIPPGAEPSRHILIIGEQCCQCVILSPQVFGKLLGFGSDAC